MVREGFLEATCDLRMTPGGDHWAKSRGKGVPGRGHSISKYLVSARHWGSCGRGEAGRVSRIQDLQAEDLRLWIVSIGSHGEFYAGEDRASFGF